MNSAISEEARHAAAHPGPSQSVLAGYIADPSAFADQERTSLAAKIGDLSRFRVTQNRILLAIWIRPKELRVKGGGSLILPDQVTDEDKYQGNCGLILKTGPTAFVSDTTYQFHKDEIATIGDWVLFRRGDGFRLRVNGVDCWMLESERGIKAIIPQPDMVF